jgi:hypothetical protein
MGKLSVVWRFKTGNGKSLPGLLHLGVGAKKKERIPPTRKTMVVMLARGSSGGGTDHLAFCYNALLLS